MSAIVSIVLSVLAGCSKSEVAPDMFRGDLNLRGPVVTAGTSKAYIGQDGQSYYCTWEIDDTMNVYFDQVSNAGKQEFVNSVPGEYCSFGAAVEQTTGKHKLYGYYPSAALVANSENTKESTVVLNIPASQKPVWACSDPKADILVLKPYEIQLSSGATSIENIRFARMGAVVKITPVDDTGKKLLTGENMTLISMTSNDVALAGKVKINLNDVSAISWTETKDSVCATYGQYDYFTVDDDHSAFLIVKPTTIPAGAKVSFTVRTTKHTAHKTVTLSQPLEFREGKLATIALFFVDGEVREGSDPPGPTPGGETTALPKWPEVPSTPTKTGDYYYTGKITDVTLASGKKARNYSACYSKKKMCAMWVASPMHDFYAVKNTKRSEAYKTDPAFNFTQPGQWSGYTRGHMLGSAERLVSATTNQQVFYYTNIAPQIQKYFNTGGGVWNDCEDYFCDKQWVGAKDTTYMITGCYWDPSITPKYVNGTEIPTHYYKILLRTKNHVNKPVVKCTADELQCIAVILRHQAYSSSHSILPSQYESKGLFRTVKQMEELTGFTFFPNVPNAPKDSYNVKDWTIGK